MFNFDSLENVTNKLIQLSDVKVFANDKIRIGEDARKKLNLTEGRNIIIQRAGSTLVIASTAADSGNGRSVNTKGEFMHQGLAHILGGAKSEWAITGDGQTHPATGDVYYALENTVNGAQERAKNPVSDDEAKEEKTVTTAETPVAEEVETQDPNQTNLFRQPVAEGPCADKE